MNYYDRRGKERARGRRPPGVKRSLRAAAGAHAYTHVYLYVRAARIKDGGGAREPQREATSSLVGYPPPSRLLPLSLSVYPSGGSDPPLYLAGLLPPPIQMAKVNFAITKCPRRGALSLSLSRGTSARGREKRLSVSAAGLTPAAAAWAAAEREGDTARTRRIAVWFMAPAAAPAVCGISFALLRGWVWEGGSSPVSRNRCATYRATYRAGAAAALVPSAPLERGFVSRRYV